MASRRTDRSLLGQSLFLWEPLQVSEQALLAQNLVPLRVHRVVVVVVGVSKPTMIDGHSVPGKYSRSAGPLSGGGAGQSVTVTPE